MVTAVTQSAGTEVVWVAAAEELVVVLVAAEEVAAEEEVTPVAPVTPTACIGDE